MDTQLDLPEVSDAEVTEDTGVCARSDQLLAEAVSLSSEAVCMKCNSVVDPFRSIIKSKSRMEPGKVKYMCRGCNAATTMLQRNMAWPPRYFSELSDAQQQSFWVACREVADRDSRFTYSKVRACLIKTLISRKSVQNSVEVWSEPKPLTAWEKEGFDIEAIKLNGKQESCPIFGEVCSFQRKKTSCKVTLEVVEEHIQKAEQAVRSKKQVADDGDDDDDSLLSGSDQGPAKKQKTGGKSKAAKGSKPISDRQLQKRELKMEELKQKKLEQKRIKDNAAVQAFANRVFSVVSPPLSECFMALDTIKQCDDGAYPQATQSSLQSSYDKLKEFKDQAGRIAKLPSKKVDGHLELDFTQANLQEVVSQAKAALKNFNEITKIVNRA